MSVWGFYGRNSSVEQASNFSIPTQQEAAHEKGKALGASHILDFIDAGVPGDLDWTDRPALSQLLDLVERGALAGVIIYDPDRLARDLGVQLAVTDICMKHHVRLEFCTQDFNASPEGMLFYQLRGAISQFERAKIRERTQRGRKKSLRSGIPTNAIRTYGLRYQRETNTWHLQEDKAAVVHQIFEWFRDGMGPQVIADRLNESGITPPFGRRWWLATVQRMLSNEAYTGTLHLHRWNFEGVRKNKFLSKERRVRPGQRPQSDWVPVKVPAIIEAGLWDVVQEGRAENRRRYAGRISPHVYIVSRILTCGVCGHHMNGATNNRNKLHPVFYYRCSGRYGEQKIDCDMPHLLAVDLDAAVWETVRAWLLEPDLYRAAVVKSLAARAPEAQPDRGVLEHQLAEVRADVARLERLVTDGLVREGEVRSAIRGLRDREAAIALKLTKTALPTEPPTYEALPPEVVDAFDTRERMAHMRGVLRAVTAFPDGRLELVPNAKVKFPKRL